MLQLLKYLSERKKWWLLPIILIIVGLGFIVIFSSHSAIAPFIYTIF